MTVDQSRQSCISFCGREWGSFCAVGFDVLVYQVWCSVAGVLRPVTGLPIVAEHTGL